LAQAFGDFEFLIATPARIETMAAQEANVLADLGRGWLQCQDQQGIFYFNQTTQQSSDVLPAELRGAQQQPLSYVSAQQLQALPQQQSYATYAQPLQMPQSYGSIAQQRVQPQAQYMQMAQAQPQVQYVQQAQAQPKAQYVQQTQAQPQVQYMQQAQAQPQVQYVQQAPSYQPQAQFVQQAAPQQAQSSVKLEVGDWMVCEDAMGEFYHHSPTGQSFDQAPAQLVELIKASQRPQVQIANSTTAAMQAYGQQLAGNVQYVQYG